MSAGADIALDHLAALAGFLQSGARGVGLTFDSREPIQLHTLSSSRWERLQRREEYSRAFAYRESRCRCACFPVALEPIRVSEPLIYGRRTREMLRLLRNHNERLKDAESQNSQQRLVLTMCSDRSVRASSSRSESAQISTNPVSCRPTGHRLSGLSEPRQIIRRQSTLASVVLDYCTALVSLLQFAAG